MEKGRGQKRGCSFRREIKAGKSHLFLPLQKEKMIGKLPINYLFYLLGIHDPIMAVANL